MQKAKLTPYDGLWSLWAQRQGDGGQCAWLHLGACKSLLIAGRVAKAVAQLEATP